MEAVQGGGGVGGVGWGFGGFPSGLVPPWLGPMCTPGYLVCSKDTERGVREKGAVKDLE